MRNVELIKVLVDSAKSAIQTDNMDLVERIAIQLAYHMKPTMTYDRPIMPQDQRSKDLTGCSPPHQQHHYCAQTGCFERFNRFCDLRALKT
jgi:hypothetical protein